MGWNRGEPCPVCGEYEPFGWEKDIDAWKAWAAEHMKSHQEAKG